MSTTEFPAPGAGAGITSQIEVTRSRQFVFRNSRFLCYVTISGSFFAAIMGVASVLALFSQVFPLSEFNSDRGWNALRWGLSALAMGFMCPWFWRLGHAMAEYKVVFENRGVTFNLGTKKAPSDLFLPWDQISAIKRRRNGNVQQVWVEGKDGSEVRFSSYTFFRPKKVARLIAERTGLAIQKSN
jgi:hypothetical protein